MFLVHHERSGVQWHLEIRQGPNGVSVANRLSSNCSNTIMRNTSLLKCLNVGSNILQGSHIVKNAWIV